MPIEQELFNVNEQEIPIPSKINILGQLFLIIIFPIIPLTWLLSLTLAPLVYNSIRLAIKSYVIFTNLSIFDLPEEQQLTTTISFPSFLRNIYGLPGLILGSSIAMLSSLVILTVRTLTNTWKNFATTYFEVINLGLNQINKPFDLPHFDPQHTAFKALGFVGYGLGYLLGGLSLLTFGIIFVVYNSWRTASNLIPNAINLVRKNTLDVLDERDELQQQLGSPGYLLGLVPAVIGFTAAGVERVILESWKAAYLSYVTLINASLHKDMQLTQPVPDWKNVDRFFFSIPGWIVGSLAGGISFLAIGFSRIISNTPESFIHTFAEITNKALAPDDEFTHIGFTADKRSRVEFFLGLPGLILGGVAGLLGYSAVGIGRVFTNSWLTAAEITRIAINIVRKDTLTVGLDARSNWHKYGLGIFGLPLGMFTGAIGFTAAGVERVILESWKAAYLSYVTLINASLHKDMQLTQPVPDWKNVDRFFFSIPGWIFGALSGGISFIAISIGRIIGNSTLNVVSGFIQVSNILLDEKSRIKIDAVEAINGFNFIGKIIGGSFGVIAWIPLILGHILINSLHTGIGTMASMCNPALAENLRFKSAGIDKDVRHWLLQWVIGLPGAIGGFAVGYISLASIYVAKLAYNSYVSARALTGSLLNLAIGRLMFDGIGDDNRVDANKAAGSIGYLTALITIAPVVLIIFSARIIIPSIFVLALGSLGALFVAPIKTAKQPRFEQNAIGLEDSLLLENEDSTIQRFKNLYSTLDAWGNFPENAFVLTNAAGNKGLGCFIRKSVTFNEPTLTEYILDQALEAYRKSDDINKITADIKEYYQQRNCSCLQTPEDKIAQEMQIEEIIMFIENYLKDSIKKVPNGLYSKHDLNFSDTFFGQRKFGATVVNAPINPEASTSYIK